jgi:hypothetical protein
MTVRTFLIVAGTLFALQAIGQLIRVVFLVPIEVGALTIPVWPSIVGLLVTLVLCIWAFRLASR